MADLSSWRKASAVFLLCAATAIVAPAQTFNTLVSFDGTDGGNPYAGLLQGTNGNFYGTTARGGTGINCNVDAGCGTLFEITPSGTLTTFSFDGTDGGYPYTGLTLATDGNFYGTTKSGGGYGTVFIISPAGKLTTIYSFCRGGLPCTDGAYPSGLTQAINGNFYGTTAAGGEYDEGQGTIFKITSTGALTTLYSFCKRANCTDGTSPFAGLVQATDGNFYGTTMGGGANCVSNGNCGTVFKITPGGKLTTLYSFCAQPNCTDGMEPVAPLVQASNGNFYGTTSSGGTNAFGTVFDITAAGNLTTLYSFCSEPLCADGANPYAGLVQATDGNLYGTTVVDGGGGGGGGTIFEITPTGVFTSLYSFCLQLDCPDGDEPYAGLLQATNGTFYGTNAFGGSNDGTVFSLSTGLGPFVKTVPAAAKIGVEVRILGTNLSGATSVTFNGTATHFSVRSPTLILTHVPAGATTGTIQVTLPGQTLSSNVPFYVLP
jgi:uncharacterized repeat protein (TIGR03803 family)